MANKKFNKILSLIVIFAFFSNNLCSSQESFEPAIWEFTDKNSDPIVAGILTRIDKTGIRVRDGLGASHFIAFKTLSKSSQQFIKSVETSIERMNSSTEKAKKLLTKLDSSSSKLKIKTLESLSNFGTSATFAVELIANTCIENENEIGVAAFYTYLAICTVEEKSAEIAHRLIRENSVVKLEINQNPLKYFKLSRRLGKFQEETLIYAAFTGSIALPPFKPELLKSPSTLITVSDRKNTIRSMAAYSLACVRTPNSSKATFETLKEAEKKINGQNDMQTIKAIYTGCAECGWQFTAVNQYMDLYKKYRGVFKTQASQWEENWNKRLATRQEQERLQKSSKMRNFKDPKGSFLMRGKVEKIEGGLVLFTDHTAVRRTLKLRQFSQDDIRWLLDNELHD